MKIWGKGKPKIQERLVNVGKILRVTKSHKIKGCINVKLGETKNIYLQKLNKATMFTVSENGSREVVGKVKQYKLGRVGRAYIIIQPVGSRYPITEGTLIYRKMRF